MIFLPIYKNSIKYKLKKIKIKLFIYIIDEIIKFNKSIFN